MVVWDTRGPCCSRWRIYSSLVPLERFYSTSEEVGMPPQKQVTAAATAASQKNKFKHQNLLKDGAECCHWQNNSVQKNKKSTLCNFLLQNTEDILKNVVNQKVLVYHSRQIYQQSNQIPSKIKEFQSKKFCLLLAAFIRTKQYNQRQRQSKCGKTLFYSPVPHVHTMYLL